MNSKLKIGNKSLIKLSLVIMVISGLIFIPFYFASTGMGSVGSEIHGPRLIVHDPVVLGNIWSKKIIVYHNDSEHHYNISVNTTIPENLRDIELYRYLTNDLMKRITDDPAYSFQTIDTDDNGKDDTVSWFIPELSEVSFAVEGIIIEQETMSVPETTIIQPPEISEAKELRVDQLQWVKGMEKNGATTSIVKTEGGYMAKIEKNSIRIEFERFKEEYVDWNKMVEVTQDVDIKDFISKRGFTLKDFVWVEPNGFIEGGYEGRIILPSTYRYVFMCEGSKEDPDCFFIQRCSISRPCYEEQDGRTHVFLDHFSGAGGGDPEILLYVDGFVEEYTGWDRTGSSPYLDAMDYPTNFINSSTDYESIGNFTFENTGLSGTINSVEIQLNISTLGAIGDPITVYIWNGSWQEVGTLPSTAENWYWRRIDITSTLNTWNKINNAQMFINTTNLGDPYNPYVDAARLNVTYTPINYPQSSDNSTNSTLAGTSVEFRLKWTDVEGLSGYIFSWVNGSESCSPNCPTNVQAESGFIHLTGTSKTVTLSNSYNISKAFIIRNYATHTTDSDAEPDGATVKVEWVGCTGDICNQLIATRYVSTDEDAVVSYSILQADNIQVWNFTLIWSTGERDKNFDPNPDLPTDYLTKCFVNVFRATMINSGLISDFVEAEIQSNITAANNVNFHREGEDGGSPAAGETAGEVVCFLDETNVQQVFKVMGESEPRTDNVAIEWVNLTESFAIHNHWQPDDGVGQNAIINNLTTSTNLQLYYAETGQTAAGDQPNMTIYVVDLENNTGATTRNIRISPSSSDQNITTNFSPPVSNLNKSLLICYNSMAAGGGTAHTRDYWAHAFVDEDTIRSINYRTRGASQTTLINCWIIEWSTKTTYETGELVFDNVTWVTFPTGGTEDWSNVTKVVNDTIGATIRWKVYANDTSNNWNSSEIFSFTTTGPDVTKPYFINASANTTRAGNVVNFSIEINDETAVDSYIFSTNNTGTWINSSVIVTGKTTKETAYNITTLNDTVGAVVQWRFYANDTSNNWNSSEIFNTTTIMLESPTIAYWRDNATIAYAFISDDNRGWRHGQPRRVADDQGVPVSFATYFRSSAGGSGSFLRDKNFHIDLLFSGHGVTSHGYKHAGAQIWSRGWYENTTRVFNETFGFVSPVLVYPNCGTGSSTFYDFFVYGRTCDADTAGDIDPLPDDDADAGQFGGDGMADTDLWNDNFYNSFMNMYNGPRTTTSKEAAYYFTHFSDCDNCGLGVCNYTKWGDELDRINDYSDVWYSTWNKIMAYRAEYDNATITGYYFNSTSNTINFTANLTGLEIEYPNRTVNQPLTYVVGVPNTWTTMNYTYDGKIMKEWELKKYGGNKYALVTAVPDGKEIVLYNQSPSIDTTDPVIGNITLKYITYTNESDVLLRNDIILIFDVTDPECEIEDVNITFWSTMGTGLGEAFNIFGINWTVGSCDPISKKMVWSYDWYGNNTTVSYDKVEHPEWWTEGGVFNNVTDSGEWDFYQDEALDFTPNTYGRVVAFNVTNTTGGVENMPVLANSYEYKIVVKSACGRTTTYSSIPPTFSNNATNTTIAGKPANFTLDWSDDLGLSGYIFSTNNSGSWINSSFVSFSGTTNTSWNVTTLNDTVGAVVQWRFYANDTNDNWNVSEEYSLATTGYPKYVEGTNSTNSTLAGTAVEFRLKWTDTEGLHGHIFSLDNCTGTFVNQSFQPLNKSATITEELFVDGNDTSFNEWYGKVGSEPWLGDNDDYIYERDAPDKQGNFTFADHSVSAMSIASVNLTLEVTVQLTSAGDHNVTVYLYDGNSWQEIWKLNITDTNWHNRTTDITSYLDTFDKVNNAEVMFGIAGVSGVLNDRFIRRAKLVLTLYPYPTEAWINSTSIYTINDTMGCTIKWKDYANNTFNNWNVSEEFSFVTSGAYLEVSLESPPSSYNAIQNQVFNVNATVTCKGGSCGSVNGTVRYNGSSENPDIPINITEGDKPFYITFPGNATSQPSTVFDSGNNGTQYETERRVFRNPRGQKYYYALAYNNTNYNLSLYKSSNGISWEKEKDIKYFGSDSYNGSSLTLYENVTEQQLVVYFVYSNSSGALFYRRGNISDAGSTVSLDNEQIIYTTNRTKPVIQIANDGYVWVVYDRDTNSYHNVTVIVSTTPYPNGNPSWSPEFFIFNNTASGYEVYPTIAPLSATQDILVHWLNYDGSTVQRGGVELSYDGSTITNATWQILNEGTMALDSRLPLVVDSNNKGWSLLVNATTIYISPWEVGSGFQPETSIGPQASYESISLAIDKASEPDKLYAFYIKQSGKVHYKTARVDSITGQGSWSSEKAVADDSEAIAYLSTSYRDWNNDGKIQMVYTTQTNYYIRYVEVGGLGNTQFCGSMSDGDTCQLNWTVNATGAANSVWKIGVLFDSSSTSVIDNHTTNSTVTITSCTESIALWGDTLYFGTLNPNTPASNNPALDNTNNLYNITNNGVGCSLSIWIKGTDLTNDTYQPPSVIGVGNITWTNISSTYDSSYPNLTTSYVSVNSSLPVNANVTTYYWINVPPVYAGAYNGTITICGNSTSVCD